MMICDCFQENRNLSERPIDFNPMHFWEPEPLANDGSEYEHSYLNHS